MSVRQIDPKSHVVLMGGQVLGGWTDGTFINVERDADMWAMKIGCDGIGTRVKTNDKSGKVTMTFHESSSSNDILSAYAVADELSNTGAVPLLVRSASGKTVITGLTAWVTKQAVVEWTKECTDRVWIIACDSLDIFVGAS